MRYVLVSACLLGMNCRYNGIVKPDECILSLIGNSDMVCIPVCPEQMGGLQTPRLPAECRGERVVRKDGEDVTDQYLAGAAETCRLAALYGCDLAILKARSPSCGSGRIYDGSFSKTLTEGNGTTVRALKKMGITVCTEEDFEKYL